MNQTLFVCCPFARFLLLSTQLDALTINNRSAESHPSSRKRIGVSYASGNKGISVSPSIALCDSALDEWPRIFETRESNCCARGGKGQTTTTGSI